MKPCGSRRCKTSAVTDAASIALPPRPPSAGRTLILHAVTLAALAAWWVYSQFVPAYQIPGPVVVARRMLGFVTDPLLALQLGISVAHATSAIALAFVIGAGLAFLAHFVPAARLLVNSRLIPFLNAFSGIGLAVSRHPVVRHRQYYRGVRGDDDPHSVRRGINLRAGRVSSSTATLIELGISLTRARWLAACSRSRRRCWCRTCSRRLRISFGVAWKVTLTAELFGGSAGVGYVLNVARQEFDTETIFAVILFILLFVAFMEVFVFRPLQRLPRPEIRRVGGEGSPNALVQHGFAEGGGAARARGLVVDRAAACLSFVLPGPGEVFYAHRGGGFSSTRRCSTISRSALAAWRPAVGARHGAGGCPGALRGAISPSHRRGAGTACPASCSTAFTSIGLGNSRHYLVGVDDADGDFHRSRGSSCRFA